MASVVGARCVRCRGAVIPGPTFATALAVIAGGHNAALYNPTPEMLAAEVPDSIIGARVVAWRR